MASYKNPATPESHPITELWIELAVVLAFAVLPSLYSVTVRYTVGSERSVWSLARSKESQSERWAYYGHDAIRKLGTIGVLLFVIWRSREPWSQFGLTRLRWETDIIAGMALY